jgi:tetrapyrrole methylase family protein/MazG family protein
MKQINVVGLGAGDFEQLPLGVYRTLKNAENLYLRTKEHPVVQELVGEGIHFQSFDEVYEKHEQFSNVYEEIVSKLFAAAEHQDIVYAVPGHPLVAEKTVQLLLENSEAKGIDLSISGGQSFLDPLFSALKIDPIEGFQLLDATSLEKDQLNLQQHMIICQVYDAFIASEVKLTLMDQLPDEYEVIIVTAAGTKEEQIK